MTNLIYPTFQGWSYKKEKTAIWKTNIYEATSGKEVRIQKWSYPRYKITLNYNFMTDNNINSITLDKGDVEKLQGFFNSVGGNCDDFLFYDDVENYCNNNIFGTGDGSTKIFQLYRTLPNWVEPVKGIVEKPKIYINGTQTNAFTWDNDGKITFTAAPAAGAILTWTGNYYFRVRFENEELEVSRTYDGLWEGIEINLITVK
jgi:uncharacterized protein (TIGR02217 family)